MLTEHIKDVMKDNKTKTNKQALYDCGRTLSTLSNLIAFSS